MDGIATGNVSGCWSMGGALALLNGPAGLMEDIEAC